MDFNELLNHSDQSLHGFCIDLKRKKAKKCDLIKDLGINKRVACTCLYLLTFRVEKIAQYMMLSERTVRHYISDTFCKYPKIKQFKRFIVNKNI